MQPGQRARVYAFGNFVYRSDDGGANWENLTAFRSSSIVGAGLRDLAIAPGNGDELVVAGDAGVFRSADGGIAWSSLNEGLPNLPATRLLNLPAGAQGVKLALTNDEAVEWPPGDKQAWLPTDKFPGQRVAVRDAPWVRFACGRDALDRRRFLYTDAGQGVWVSADRG
jgi:photosystem II stability/assembly factor-like uncharacterized protein